MEKVLFTSQLSAAEAEKRKNSMTMMMRVFLGALLILFPIILYLMGLFKLPIDNVSLGIGLFIVAMMVMMLWIVATLLRYVLPAKYDQMPDKQFGYDYQTDKFYYKDNNRELTFSADQIEKWYSMTGRTGETTDIFLLPDEKPIVLEGEFNPEVHDFLIMRKEMLHLPKPSAMWLKIRIYG